MAGNLSESEELELLELEEAEAKAKTNSTQTQPPQDTSFPAGQIASQAGQAVLASSPANLTKKFMQTDPATMQRVGGPALPILGGMAAGPIGASLGEVARQMTGTVLNPSTVPKTPLGIGASVIGAGVAQEPKILEAIPGVTTAVEGSKRAAGSVGHGLARLGEAMSGVPAKDIKYLFKNPSVLFKPGSRDAAGKAIGEAKLAAGVNPGITKDISSFTPTNVSKAINPEKTGSEALARVSESLGNGAKPSIEDVGDALKHVGDKIKVGMRQGQDVSELINIQTHLNTTLEELAPNVQAARQEFAPLAQRDKFMKIFPTNKNGTISKANLLYLNTIAKGATAPFRAPIATGLVTAGLGGATRGLNVLNQNPVIRQALSGILQKIMTNRQNGQQP